MTGKTNSILVLSQLDTKYFKDLTGKADWSLDFILYRVGEKEPIAEVPHSEFNLRSVNLEVELEAGDYVAYVRLDRFIEGTEVRFLHVGLFRETNMTPPL